MAGLTVLLEAQEEFPKHSAQIISKTSLCRNYSLTSTSPSSPFACLFLECCYYCRNRLQEGNDIYMYRGDRAFCSEECRCQQIFIDEESGWRDGCSLAAASAAYAAAASGRMFPEARAGGGTVAAGDARWSAVSLTSGIEEVRQGGTRAHCLESFFTD